MGFPKIIDRSPQSIRWVFCRNLMGVLEIFDGCLGDIWSMSWKYLIGVLEIFDGWV